MHDSAVFIRLADGNLVSLIANVSQEVAEICCQALQRDLPQGDGEFVVAVGGKVVETESASASAAISHQGVETAPPSPLKTQGRQTKKKKGKNKRRKDGA